MDTVTTDDVIHSQLAGIAVDLENLLSADVITVNSPMQFGLDDHIRNEVEDLKENSTPKRNRLAVLLHTGGGYIDTVERIVSVFRKHYKQVDFIIPNYAYSAGTVLAMSGDEILMDYYSVLGPIDPQFHTENGKQVPGMGYIAKYRELLRVINGAPEGELHTVRAELSFLVKKFDPAELFHIEQAIDHSADLIREWLPKYKFKSWKKTAGSGKDVTPAYKRERADKIAKVLSDAEHWHSHGRGISMRELESEDIGLQIVDFGQDADLSATIRHYFGLLIDYQAKLGMASAIHTKRRLRRVA